MDNLVRKEGREGGRKDGRKEGRKERRKEGRKEGRKGKEEKTREEKEDIGLISVLWARSEWEEIAARLPREAPSLRSHCGKTG